jgi:hypothetical protein
MQITLKRKRVKQRDTVRIFSRFHTEKIFWTYAHALFGHIKCYF